MRSFKSYFTKFLEGHQGHLHLTAHSHHFWPDISLEAQTQYWLDAARLSDHKWDYFFNQLASRLKTDIAGVIGGVNSEQLVFAPNTHELLYRLLSTLPEGKPIRILTSDSEFYSFSRQINRLEETGRFFVTRVKQFPRASFLHRWQKALAENVFDMAFISQVFFNSGQTSPWLELLKCDYGSSCLFVLDAYHAYFALPTNLHPESLIAHGVPEKNLERFFYLAGAYKYAMAGEGGCFMYTPKNTPFRPLYTGWFAQLGQLEAGELESEPVSDEAEALESKGAWIKQKVYYPSATASCFLGSTMDFTPLYRQEAVFRWLREVSLDVPGIHAHVQSCQKAFLEALAKSQELSYFLDFLLFETFQEQGHFFAFDFKTPKAAAQALETLKAKKILADLRGSVLRVGFGIYHDPEDFLKI